jgi:ABC-type cobalt transport system substrate-binding protein
MKRLAVFLMLLFFVPLFAASASTGAWRGVDENVVEKIADEHGRSPSRPLINTDNGDLLLFVFLVAGAVGGFVAGYSYRMITADRRVVSAKGKTRR